MTYYTYTEGPLGRMLFTASETGLTGMYFVGQKYEATPQPDWTEEDHVIGVGTPCEQQRCALTLGLDF